MKEILKPRIGSILTTLLTIAIFPAIWPKAYWIPCPKEHQMGSWQCVLYKPLDRGERIEVEVPNCGLRCCKAAKCMGGAPREELENKLKAAFKEYISDELWKGRIEVMKKSLLALLSYILFSLLLTGLEQSYRKTGNGLTIMVHLRLTLCVLAFWCLLAYSLVSVVHTRWPEKGLFFMQSKMDGPFL